MIAYMLWGAIFLLLLETAAIASPLQRKQIDFRTRWEALNELQRLRREHRGEDTHDEALVFDETLTKQPGASEGARARRGLQSICLDGDSFYVTSTWFPFLEGCFLDSGYPSNDGKSSYEYNSSFVVGSVPFLNDTFNISEGSYWYVVEAFNDTSVDIFCISEEDATTLPHPTDATWICDVNGDEQFDLPDSSEFSITCGCSADAHGGSSLWAPLSAFTTFGVGLLATVVLFEGV